MNKIELIEQTIRVQNEKLVVSSRDVAKIFEKRHDNILKDIKNLEIEKDFGLLIYQRTKQKAAGISSYP